MRISITLPGHAGPFAASSDGLVGRRVSDGSRVQFTDIHAVSTINCERSDQSGWVLLLNSHFYDPTSDYDRF